MHDDSRLERTACRHGRGRRPLQAAFQQDPRKAYSNYRLGQEFEARGDFAAAAACYARSLTTADALADWRHDLVLRLLISLKNLRRFEDGMALGNAEMALWSHSPDFFFVFGDLLLDWAAACPPLAPSLLPMVESSWLRALQVGEDPALRDAVVGRGGFLAAQNLALMFEAWADLPKARLWRERATLMRRTAEAVAA